MAQTRRQFLAHAGCGALSSAALLSGLGRFALIDALAQSTAPIDYKALVCVFLFGGNDANNMVIPIDNYAAYDAARRGAMFAVPKDDLLPISTSQGGFGLNPKLGEGSPGSLYDLWRAGKAAIVCNTGPLIRPVTRDEYRSGLNRPYQLFSHSDQQNLWQTSYATGTKQTGWAGLTAEKPYLGGGSFPPIASIAGVTVFSTGLNTRPLVLTPAPTALNATLQLLNTYDQDAIRQALTADEADAMPSLIRGAAKITDAALTVSDTLSTDPMIDTVFPNSSLGNQLKQVAKVIKFVAGNPTFGVKRQIFFTSLGGFDTHTNQGAFGGDTGQLGLLRQVSQAIAAFYTAMSTELSLGDKVTLFTSSDFSRTMVPGGSGSGTDHAWGSHQFVVGDAVAGGKFFGTYPDLVLGDSLDTDAGSGARGRWIPTTSVDQYAATLADWYGLLPGDRATVFPNIGNFSPQILGFMTPPAGAGPRRSNTTG